MKRVNRRQVIDAAGALAALGIVVSVQETADALTVAPLKEVRTLTLTFKVPENLVVKTVIQPTGSALPLTPVAQLKATPNFTPLSAVTMDLTTAKTATWLNKASAGATSDDCTCCVRG
jgi:hypothetical protein